MVRIGFAFCALIAITTQVFAVEKYIYCSVPSSGWKKVFFSGVFEADYGFQGTVVEARGFVPYIEGDLGESVLSIEETCGFGDTRSEARAERSERMREARRRGSEVVDTGWTP